MNSTFRCWIIANFEIAMFWLVTILGGLFFLIFASDKADILHKYSKLLLGCGLFTFALNTPTKSAGFQYGKYIIMLVVAIFAMWSMKEPSGNLTLEDMVKFKHLFTWFWILFSIASVISGVLAYYAYSNIDEVLSLRMLYRNSNVGLFEYTWKYTLDRFCNITVSIVTSILWLVIIIYTSLGKIH